MVFSALPGVSSFLHFKGNVSKPESHVLIFLFFFFSFFLSQIILNFFLYRINKTRDEHSLLFQINYFVDYCICQGGERWEFISSETETDIDPRVSRVLGK